MLAYIWAGMPFKGPGSNVINIYNEALLIVIFISIIFINEFPTSNETMNNVGWFLIALILISLFATWYMVIPNLIRETYENFKQCFRKSEDSSSISPDNLPQNVAKGDDKIHRKQRKNYSTKNIQIINAFPTMPKSNSNINLDSSDKDSTPNTKLFSISDLIDPSVPEYPQFPQLPEHLERPQRPIPRGSGKIMIKPQKSIPMRTEPSMSTRQMLGGHP